MKIWKYPLAAIDLQELMMPVGARILTAQIQGENGLQLWALVNDLLATRAKRIFAIYGTGNPMPDEPGEYISTFQLMEGALVFHVFELTQ